MVFLLLWLWYWCCRCWYRCCRHRYPWCHRCCCWFDGEVIRMIDINQSVSFDLTSTVSKQTTKQLYHFHFFAYCCILFRMGDQSDAGLRLILSLSLFYASFIVFSPFYYIIDDDDRRRHLATAFITDMDVGAVFGHTWIGLRETTTATLEWRLLLYPFPIGRLLLHLFST